VSETLRVVSPTHFRLEQAIPYRLWFSAKGANQRRRRRSQACHYQAVRHNPAGNQGEDLRLVLCRRVMATVGVRGVKNEAGERVYRAA